MKPVCLEISGLGPFVGPLLLDFRALGDNRLFLLNGPTGSGKTMLLDAISFALFGETTGKVRSAKSLRSQHAPPDVRTAVTFDFALGGEQYRVERLPEQERPARRGGGTTTDQPKATLWQRTGIADDSTAGSVLAARPSEVTAKVQEILGFTAEQFRHVTVLPQGEFQRFLNASSDDREDILEVLFQTGRHRLVQEALSKREGEARRAAQSFSDRQALLLEQAAAENESQLRERLETTRQQLEGAGSLLAALRLSQQAAQSAFDAGREAARNLNELRAAETAHDTLQARTPELERQTQELAGARRAAPIVPLEADSRQREQEAVKAVGEAAGAQTAHEKAGTDAEAAALALRVEEAREPERLAAVHHEQRLKDIAGKTVELAKARRDATTANRACQATATRLATAKEAVAACVAAIDAASKELAEVEEAAARVEILRADSAQLQRTADKRVQLAGARQKLERSQQTSRKAAATLESAGIEYVTARAALEAADLAWVEAQAAILAHSLVPGAACPVCGSTEHPAPAQSERPLPAEKDRKQKRDAVAKADAAREVAAAADRAANTEETAARTAVEALATDLTEWASMPEAEFAAAVLSAKGALSVGEAAAVRAGALKQAMAATRLKQTADEQEREVAEAADRAASAESERLSALVTERASGVPPEYQDARKLEAAVQQAGVQVRSLQLALQSAREAANSAATKLSAAGAHAESTAAQAVRAREAANVARQRMDQAIEGAAFPTEAQFRAAVRTSAQIAALDRAIQQFRGDLKAAQERLRRARDDVSGVAQPILEDLETALTGARKNTETGALEEARLQRDCVQQAAWLAGLEECARLYDEAERKHRIISTLAQAASGNNGRRITLQRFVQVTLLERVLTAATVRLQLMSNQRYWLRVAQNLEDLRRQAGLDLEVFDAHTGQARRVSTLSGGESFLASLSLALGLSDVVQSCAGGYHLESIFVDEGFGALDPESLELALATLRDLQQGGRLVGIISHVPELRHQIDVRLDVIPCKRGSTAHFVVPGLGSSVESLPRAIQRIP
jgi:exonuclease SbcC